MLNGTIPQPSPILIIGIIGGLAFGPNCPTERAEGNLHSSPRLQMQALNCTALYPNGTGRGLVRLDRSTKVIHPG